MVEIRGRLDGIYKVPQYIPYRAGKKPSWAEVRRIYPPRELNLSWRGVNSVQMYEQNPVIPG